MMSKILMYAFLNSSLGKFLIKLLPVLSAVSFSHPKKPCQKKIEQEFPFFIALTIDVESGYVEKNGKRVWQDLNPYAFQGYYYGLKNWCSLLNKHQTKATFLVASQCFSAEGKTLKRIIKQLIKTHKEGHEIGFHLHPKNDYALQNYLEKKFFYNSAKFYELRTIKEMLLGGKMLMRRHLGKEIAEKLISFRWGNWGLDSTAVKALEETSFKIDTSACPGIRGHLKDDRIYDWSKTTTSLPWKLNKEDYQNINGDSKVLEFPITTFQVLGFPFRADPNLSDFLIKAFDFFYRNTDRTANPFFFVVISHSSEATLKNGEPTDVVKTMDRLIRKAKESPNIRFVTLREALSIYEEKNN